MARVDLAGRLSDARERVEEADAAASSIPSPPLFARLTRKEARVREDQYAALSALARTLMRRRRVKVARITENTLIRVAIDLLLAHQETLRGATEHELRKSVTSALPRSGSSEDGESRSPAGTEFAPSVDRVSGTPHVRHTRSSEVPPSLRSDEWDGEHGPNVHADEVDS